MKERATVDDRLLRHHLYETCTEAIRCGIRSEQVLIGLMDLWRTLPSCNLPESLRREGGMRRALVAGVLDAYYGAK